MTLNRALNASLPVGSTLGNLQVLPSGASVYNIPLIIAPGTAGMQPNISITYSSKVGNDIMGFGWGISGISSITRTGQTKYYDNNTTSVQLTGSDRFLLDGQRIVAGPVTYGGPGVTHYMEVENFSTVVSYGTTGTGPTYFIVTKKDGTKIWYGNYDGSNAYLKSNSNASIIAWFIARIEDRRGNYMKFNYGQDLVNGETWINSITYTGNAGASLTPYNSINFTYYTGDRDDKQVGYLAGCKLTRNKLISKIETKNGSNLVRKYVPKYYFDEAIKLNEIEERYGDGTNEKYNSIAVGYGPKAGSTLTSRALQWISEDVDKELYFGFADFNSDGRTDFIKCILTNQSTREFRWETWINENNGYTKKQTGSWRFTSAYGFNFVPGDFNADGLIDIGVCVKEDTAYTAGDVYCFASGGESLSCSSSTKFYVSDIYSVSSGDVNTDSQTDFIIINNGNITTGIYTDKDLTKTPTFTNINLNVANYKNFISNFNNDPKPDLVSLQNSSFKVYTIGQSSYQEIFSSTLLSMNNTTRMYPGDFNGDKLLDILGWSAGNGWKVYLNTGTQFITGTAPGLPSIDMELNPLDHNIFLNDFNRDGQTDILYAYRSGSGSNLEYYFSTNTAFTKVTVSSASSSPYVNKHYIRSFFDFNGDGNADIFCKIYNDGACGIYVNNSEDLDNLVTSILQGTNVLTTITYACISKYDNNVYTKGTGAVHPLMDFQGPIYVVKSMMETAAGQTLTNRSYSYKGAKVHKLGKGFLGFSQFKVIDNLTGYSTENNYLIKIVDNKYYYPYNSSVLIKQGSNSISYTYTNIGITTYSQILKFLPYTISSFTNNYLDDIRITDTYVTYDSYGNPTKKIREYKADDNSTQGHGTVEATITTDMTWVPSVNSYLLSTSKITTQRSGQAINERNFSYTYTSAHLTDIIKSDPGTTFEVWEDKDYDVCGNLTQSQVKDKNGVVLRKMNYKYRDGKRRFCTTTINALNDSVVYTYDPKYGNVLTTTNAQGITTTNTYDNFGRILNSVTPEGTSTVSYSWTDDGYISYDRYCIQKTAPDNSYVKEYYDAFGRKVHERVTGFNGNEVNTSIKYNSKNQVWQVSEPYYFSESSKYITYAYDDYGRKISESSYRMNIQYTYPEVRKVVTTNGLNTVQTSWQKSNSLGEIVQSHDLGGDLKCTYNAIGKLVKTESPGGINTLMEYDLVGNQTKLTDPDAGLIQYQYDLLGQLKKQTDAKNQVYDMTYDILGRLITQTNSTEGTNTYTYETAQYGKGMLKSVANNLTGINHSFTFDNLSRVQTESEVISGITYSYSYGYDPIGRVNQITYPGGFVIKNVYGSYGGLKKVTESNDTKIWEITDMSSHSELINVAYGNGTSTQYSYDTYHQPSEIKTITSGSLTRQQLQYSFNYTTGNLTWRKDLLANGGSGITENFTYDNLDRLLTYKAGSNPTYTINYNTDGTGRFVSKSDIGTYVYGTGTVPHAPIQVTGSDGNVISRTQQDVTYTPFQTANKITQGTTVLDLVYGPEHSRKKTELKNGGTLVKRKIYVGSLYELEEDNAGNKKHFYYIPGPDGEAAIFVKNNAGNITKYYIHKDYQGTYQTITDASGNIVETLNFDPWGKRRNATNWSYTGVPTSFTFDRGYTGHEHLDAFGLINMNGRVFDPELAHFLSPDNTVQAPEFTQSYNRYAYCLNNPLKYTDPSGWEWNVVAVSEGGGCVFYNLGDYMIYLDWLNSQSSYTRSWYEFEYRGGFDTYDVVSNTFGNPGWNGSAASQIMSAYYNQDTPEGGFSYGIYHFEGGSLVQDLYFAYDPNYNSSNNTGSTSGSSNITATHSGESEGIAPNGAEIYVAGMPPPEAENGGDVYFTDNPNLSIDKQLPATCVTSIMEYLSQVFGANKKQGYYDLDYIKTYGVSFSDYYQNGVSGANLYNFVNRHFKTSGFSSFISAIDNGSPVMTDMFVRQNGNVIDTHNVLVIGYGGSDIIILNSVTGGTQRVPASNLGYTYSIPIIGIR